MFLVRCLIIVLLATVAAEAAVFVVPSDEELVRESPAIVTAIAGPSHARRLPGKGIETVTPVEVLEVVRGAITPGSVVEIVSPGGVIGREGLLVHGAARFRQGERVLLFLDPLSPDEWTPRRMAVGKFTFAAGLLERDSGSVCGFGSDGTPHHEPRRSAERFLRFVAGTARGERMPADYVVTAAPRVSTAAIAQPDAAPVSSWLMSHSGRAMRWQSFPSPVVFRSNGVQPNASGGGVTAARRGIAVWTDDPGSNIVYQYGGTTTATSAFRSADGVNSILFNDPSGEVSQPGVLAIGGVHFFTTTTHRFGGEEFLTVLEADLVVQNGLALPGVAGPGFDRLLAHELGHTLGLRHSDEPPAGGTTSSTAIMTSTIDFHGDRVGAALQSWDRDAIAAVYGSSGPPACAPPVITGDPASVALISVPVTLSVSASGTGPLTYQWYAGSRGDTRSPIGGATLPSVSVQPSQTTSYWARVTGACAPPADSLAGTVTVNGCPAIVLTSTPTGATIIQGRTHVLSVSADSANRALTYRWFEGERGDTSRPAGSGASLAVTPSVTTQYWAEIANDCGATVTTEAVLVTVVPCTAPHVLLQPASAEAIVGDSVSLAATVAGSQPLRFQWFEGEAGETARPVNNGVTASVTSPPIFAPTSFWLRATNDCGEARTSTAAVAVVPACTPPQIVVQPQDVTVTPGMSATLSMAAAGPSISYRWYQGPLFDYTRPVGVSAPQLITPPIEEATQFWVEVRNPCGSVNSVVVTVTPANARRRAAGR